MKTDIHIFSPGTQTSAQGVTREFTATDLKQVADSYNSDLHEAPIRIGHEDNDKVPSWGWVKQVKMKGEDLYAEVEFSPLMEDYVKNGLYKKVSASFYAPESKINPDPGMWSLRHVAMLGAQPPAVKGLKGFAYAEESAHEGVLDFAVEMKLSPDQVFDEELGPTLDVDQSPLEFLKDQLEEARQEMAKEKEREAEMDTELEAAGVEEATKERPDSDFAEEEKVMKKKPSKAKQGAEDIDEEEEGEGDAVDSKEKKMDPVGKEDSDIDNDGDSDETDSYLKNRRKAIKAAITKKVKNSPEDTSDNGEMKYAGCDGARKYMEKYDEAKHGSMKSYQEKYSDKEEMKKYMEIKKDTSDNQEYETDEGEGPVASKVKKDKSSGKPEGMGYNEVSVPDGVDAAQWEAGFKDALDKFYAGVEAGVDEVVHEEAEDQTADYLAGIEAGFEFGQCRMNRIGSEGIGSAKHNEPGASEEAVVEGEGPVASKVKKQKSGANETDAEKDNNFDEATFDGSNSKSKKKRGHDSDMSSDVGVKAESEYEEDDAQHADPKTGIEDERMKTGKTKESDASNRKKKGTADSGAKAMMRDTDYKDKGSDSGAQDKDRVSKGTGKAEDLSATGKDDDVQDSGNVEYKSLGNGSGSGKQIKSPAVRVMRFSEQQFSELAERLEQLEAANARLVAEKQAAVARAHRMQLNDFAESLYATGRLTEAMIEQDELVDYMEGLENGTLEFSEGETAATKLMEILAALPQQVEFSEVAGHDLEAVPTESLDPHERALRMSKEEGLSYTEALKQTLFTAE